MAGQSQREVEVDNVLDATADFTSFRSSFVAITEILPLFNVFLLLDLIYIA